MAIMKAIIVVSLAATIYAAGSSWPALQVTFGIGGNSFADMPRTSTDAASKGWHVVNPDCKNGGKYNGYRVILGQDTSLSLLYDVQGTIAGIQMNVDKNSVAVSGNHYRYKDVSMYVDDNIEGTSVWTLTAYFVDPSTICTTGRNPNSLSSSGTGDRLYLQNGPTPSSVIEVPLDRNTAIAQEWTKNRCFVAMGYHNFFQSPKFQDSNCETFRPVFLLFDKEFGSLIGFGFASVGKAASANSRYENPSKNAIQQIVGADLVSQCLLDLADGPGLTTMHVYFTSKNAFRYTCL